MSVSVASASQPLKFLGGACIRLDAANVLLNHTAAESFHRQVCDLLVRDLPVSVTIDGLAIDGPGRSHDAKGLFARACEVLQSAVTGACAQSASVRTALVLEGLYDFLNDPRWLSAQRTFFDILDIQDVAAAVDDNLRLKQGNWTNQYFHNPNLIRSMFIHVLRSSVNEQAMLNLMNR